VATCLVARVWCGGERLDVGRYVGGTRSRWRAKARASVRARAPYVMSCYATDMYSMAAEASDSEQEQQDMNSKTLGRHYNTTRRRRRTHGHTHTHKHMPIHARAPAAGKSQSASMRLLSGRCATSLRAHVHDLSPLWLGLSPPLSLTHGPFLSHVPPCCRRHCNGRVAALGQSLYPSIRSPLSLSTAQLPVPARDETSDQPTQQMPQLTDDNRATTRCPLLCPVALCAACRHS
jgi:hypothetical protein